MKMLLHPLKSAFASRPLLGAFFLFATPSLVTAVWAETQYRFDNDNTTVILENYPDLTQNLVSGGTNGVPATGNRVVLQGNGNLYVGVLGDSNIAGSGFESMEINGPEWLIGGTVTLTGTSATTFHVMSGTTTIGGPAASMGWIVASNGSGPKATIDAGASLVIGMPGNSSFVVGNGNISVGGIINNGSLIFSKYNATFYDNISGSGSVYQTYSGLTLTGSNTYSGGTYITSGTIIAKNAYAVGAGKIDFLTAYCTLAMQLTTPANVAFNNELVGPGRFLVNLGSGTNVFNFGNTVGTQFTGNFYFEQGVLDLSSGLGGTALSNSILHLANSSTTAAATVILGSGTTRLGSLILGNGLSYNARNGGSLVFKTNIENPAAPIADSFLKVGDFTMVSSGTLGASGTIRLATTTVMPTGTLAVPTSSLFEQDDANIVTQLVSASGSVSVNASNLTLVNASGTVISNAQTRDLVQGTSGTVAKTTYDYRLTTGANNDGLYINYGLTNIEILSGKTIELKNSGTGGVAANTLSARLTGAGGLDISASGVMQLNGVGSSYTGATTINSGTVLIGENNGLGSTSGVHIKPGAALDMNGRILNVGQNLQLDAGSSLNINGGYLRLALTATSGNSVIAPNSLSGGGTFRVEIPASGTGSVIFEGDNPNFSALINVANQSTLGSKVILKTADALGTGVILAGYSSAFVYENVTGTIRTSSTMPTTNPGYVLIQSSTVVMLGTTRASTNIVNSDVTYGSTANLAGTGTITVDAASTVRLGLVSQVTVSNPLVINGGVIDFVPPTNIFASRATLNDLRGTGTIWAHVNPNTGDSTIITFKKTSGNFDLKFHFMEEAHTPEQAMPIYTISGTEATATLNVNQSELSSGVYVFKLVQGTGDNILMPDTNMWYLVNDDGKVSRAAKAIVSTAAVVGAEWFYGLDSLSKRMGDMRLEFNTKGKSPKGNVWARASNQSVIAKESLCQAAFDEDYWVFNAGVDTSFRSASAITFLGLFGGVGNASRTFTNLGDGSSNSVSVGLYATWLNDSGWFADLVGKQDMLRNKFGATSSDGSRISASYDGSVTGVSLEVGKQIYLGKGKVKKWWIEPGVQAAFALLKSDDYATDSGINVHVNDSKAQQYRAQVRIGYREKGMKFLPYAKLAGVYSTSSGGEVVADQRELKADFDGMRIEAGLGGSYIINKRNQVYLEYEYASADTYTRKWSANAGYRHAW